MLLGVVVGTVVSTRKHDALRGVQVWVTGFFCL
jgi:microcompartment protein CcmK/EutM